jgi:hypothetical protein
MDGTAHVRRVFALLALVVLVGFVAQRLLQPASFGLYGHYRAESLSDVSRQQPVHQGRMVCAECHADIHDLHQNDVHWGVECEDCHGPGLAHVRYHREGTAEISPDRARMPKEYTLEGCLFCHRKLAARPANFAQIDPLEHYEFLHVIDEKTQCIECHSPHQPLFLLDSVAEARIHPVIFECDDCHDAQPQSSHRDAPHHPTVFVCADCHPSVARDFAKHEHSFLRCTACHLFHAEDEVSTRIYRSGAKEFCLLCHARRPFKDETEMPQIVFAEHIREMAPIMRRQADDLLDDPTACLQCHFDYIHDSRLIRRLQEQER